MVFVVFAKNQTEFNFTNAFDFKARVIGKDPDGKRFFNPILMRDCT